MAAWTLEGKVCLVTGANTGIGRVTALELARRGATVVLACRSEDKTRPVMEEIAAERGEGAAQFLKLDLADLAAVRGAVEELRSRGTPLHVLVNNAGLAGQRGVTADGFELAFGVNHVGPFALTLGLLELLRAAAPARIVTVASRAHYRASGIDFAAVRRPTRTLTGMQEYGVSKLANVLFSAELGRRLEGTGVTAYSLHPGVIASDIWRRVPWPIRPLMSLAMTSTEKGARTSVHCAAAPELADETGLYYDRCKVKVPSATARDRELAAALWRRSEQWTSEG